MSTYNMPVMPKNKKVRVMVVDDSMLARSLIINGLSVHPNIEVVGYAINTVDAKNKFFKLRPDVMTMDVEMPGQNGIDFLKQFLPENPVPVILVSSLNLKVFDALSAGAVDFVRKPEKEGHDVFIETLTQKILVASTAKVQSRPVRTVQTAAKDSDVLLPSLGSKPNLNNVIIALGASTGGTEATLQVMKRLPADTPGMLIVQHMPPGFTKMYAERLDRLCKMQVREAKNGDIVERGVALIAPADLQMKITKTGNLYKVSCIHGEKVSGHRPSVDVLFRSMADNVRCKMVGIIMTGMGQDGADGLLAMRKKGAYTIGQDEASSVVYGMPGVAHKIGAVITQASCENIASVLLNHLKTI